MKKHIGFAITIENVTSLVESSTQPDTDVEVTRWYWDSTVNAPTSDNLRDGRREESTGGSADSLAALTCEVAKHVIARIKELYKNGRTSSSIAIKLPEDPLGGYDPSEIVVGENGMTLADAAKLENERKDK